MGYVIYRIACTLQLLSFFFFAILAIHPNAFGFEDHLYFKLPVIALVVITILNDGCIISIAYDHVRPSHTPEKWHFVEIFTVATIIGGVAVVSSLLLLYLGLKTHEPDSILKKFGLSELDYGQVCTMIYLKVSLSDFLTVFAARTIGPFFSRFPGWQLAIAACVAMGASTVLSHEWDHILDMPEMKSLHWKWFGLGLLLGLVYHSGRHQGHHVLAAIQDEHWLGGPPPGLDGPEVKDGHEEREQARLDTRKCNEGRVPIQG